MSIPENQKVAVVTGASSGIGAASARLLADDGWHVVVAARRKDKLEALAEEIGGTAIELDVTKQESVDAFAQQLPRVDLLVNNAGGAKGLEPLVDTAIDDWNWMYETNVLGTVRLIQALIKKIEAAPDNSGLIINMSSVAAWGVYAGGSGYNAAKHGVRVISRALRLENHNIRTTELIPGRVATDFSLVRFEGDEDRAKAVYDGQLNLVAEDVAEAVRWVASLPSHVNIDKLEIRPRTQS
ncbi:SDR family oxidoreductase [Corynebacterium ammoniagenes]|uniref:Short-chain dehydrogenase n=2 Tax=Corynebacterium ammoniagenes TaxID=1697 RepID=A0AAV5G9C6_CORAM|nr:SDR family oxidoreductase [Corynebacterium ammoniagenes]AQS72690.1 SDR family oxidoreductase [Corynebacterium ammoniagenes]EFG80141.1 oxidoreductase, short chain dehydrogenase/reductase family protein [Corynebacterium ammoniagenes DSM 20306]NMF32448.1 SDR family oxidoreductase [Corynebacterium ammoniagenes]GJN43656.1 short-chain dehydrogenase [Corynebacterium ammoniagenes]